VAGSRYSELAHTVAKSIGMNIEDSRRSPRAVNYSIRLPEDSQDMTSFHLFEGRQRGVCVNFRSVLGVSLSSYLATFGKCDRHQVLIQPQRWSG